MTNKINEIVKKIDQNFILSAENNYNILLTDELLAHDIIVELQKHKIDCWRISKNRIMVNI